MRLLLTSGGITNDSIRERLVDLLGKPIEESTALAMMSAQHGHPWCTPWTAYDFVAGGEHGAMTRLGWRSVGLIELLALQYRPAEKWHAWVRDADVLLVDGGDATFLAHWLRESGFVDLFESLEDTVWVGVSAGSMVMTPRIGEDFVGWPEAAGDETLGLVDFSIFPHLGHPDMPFNTMERAERWAEEVGGPAYAIDEQTAISVVDGQVEVVSEGAWRRFNAG